MTPDFLKAHIAGVERIAAWSDVLDDINVFPVADGDTGRNLITSLMPLRYLEKDLEDTIHKLFRQYRGSVFFRISDRRFLCKPSSSSKVRKRPGLAGRQQADARNDADRFGYIG